MASESEVIKNGGGMIDIMLCDGFFYCAQVFYKSFAGEGGVSRGIHDGGGGPTGLHIANPPKMHDPEILRPTEYLASKFSTHKNTRLIPQYWFTLHCWLVLGRTNEASNHSKRFMLTFENEHS